MYEQRVNGTAFPVYSWTEGVPFEQSAQQQIRNIANLPFIYRHIAVMPDVHYGIGATVGSVIATKSAIIPAAVGLDLGCGMIWLQTKLKASDMPDNLSELRHIIESKVPHGATKGVDRGSWGDIPNDVQKIWSIYLEKEFHEKVLRWNKKFSDKKAVSQLGTLGGGNHFIEICLDENDNISIMLHSGSRGIGNMIGTHFIQLAKEDMKKHNAHLPDANLSYLTEGSENFEQYIDAVWWAQWYAEWNRKVMLNRIQHCLSDFFNIPIEEICDGVVQECHHNYISKEEHFGEEVYVTRKGAVRARFGDWCIIPGSMGERSFICKGLGNPDSFDSCSHGAGRVMSRSEAKRVLTLDDHKRDTEGVECKKDSSVIDESPKAYKNIDDVMAAQRDLVEIKHTLKQILCVKG